MDNEHRTTERAPGNRVVAEEVLSRARQRPRCILVYLIGGKIRKGGVARIIAPAVGDDVLERFVRDLTENAGQVQAVKVGDGEGEEGAEDGISRCGAELEGRRSGCDGSEEVWCSAVGLEFADCPGYSAALAVAEGYPFFAQLGKDGLGGDNGVRHVDCVEFVREI